MKSGSYLCFPGSAIICSQNSRYRLYERGEMRWRIHNYAEGGDRGGIWVVAEGCHQTSEDIGLMGSL